MKAYHGVRFNVPSAILEAFLSPDRPVVVIENIQDYSELPYSDMYRKTDIRTLAIAALFRGSRLAGALVSAFVQQPKILLEDDMALLRGLGDQAAVTMLQGVIAAQSVHPPFPGARKTTSAAAPS